MNADGKPTPRRPIEREYLATLNAAVLPKPDKQGQFPALEYARVSLARDIIRDRRAAGLTQQELADLAGTRQETISRIESGTYTASHKLIDRIDAALKKAVERRKSKKGR